MRRPQFPTLASVLLLIPGGAAQAMLSPCSYDELIREATDVVQITAPVVTPANEIGDCGLSGTVAAVFRGEIEVGATLTTTFACENPDDMVGGTIYFDAPAVAEAGAIELHLTGGTVAGYGMGMYVLREPTEASVWVPFCAEEPAAILEPAADAADAAPADTGGTEATTEGATGAAEADEATTGAAEAEAATTESEGSATGN